MAYSESWSEILSALLARDDLSVSEASWAMDQVMTGQASDAQLAAFLIALRAKGETVDEIVGFRDAVLEHAVSLDVDPMALDIVGTGGDRHGTVNVSTMASIVAAASGVPVVKHGNRAASSKSGSSDVLQALGIDLDITNVRTAQVLDEAGITFAFASKFHPGFGNVAPEASAVGVAQLDRVPIFVGVFQTRGATALVFRGDDGLDELTTTGHSHIWEVSLGAVVEHDLDPRDLGLGRAKIADLLGGDAEHNAAIARRVLQGESGPVRDIVLLNAAAGLVAFELASDPEQGRRPIIERLREKMAVAARTIDSGGATATLDTWAEATRH
jgi:anthranilate phosphoribosyltransferase